MKSPSVLESMVLEYITGIILVFWSVQLHVCIQFELKVNDKKSPLFYEERKCCVRITHENHLYSLKWRLESSKMAWIKVVCIRIQCLLWVWLFTVSSSRRKSYSVRIDCRKQNVIANWYCRACTCMPVNGANHESLFRGMLPKQWRWCTLVCGLVIRWPGVIHVITL